jgi:hypothetical protein
METVEIIVYIGVAIIVGGLVLVFVARMDPGGVYSALHRSLTGDGEVKYRKIPADEFAAEAYRVWDQCGFGSQDKDVTLYVTGSGELNRSFIFRTYKKLNFCSTVQSASEGCGAREDVIILSPPQLPAVVHVACNSTRRQLDIVS